MAQYWEGTSKKLESAKMGCFVYQTRDVLASNIRIRNIPSLSLAKNELSSHPIH